MSWSYAPLWPKNVHTAMLIPPSILFVGTVRGAEALLHNHYISLFDAIQAYNYEIQEVDWRPCYG